MASVQTCRGSHTHTVVTQPGDNDNVYIYVSGYRRACARRKNAGLQGCGRGYNDSGHRAVPSRSHQGAAVGAADRGDHQLAAHLQGPAGAPREPGRDGPGGRRRRGPRGRGAGAAGAAGGAAGVPAGGAAAAGGAGGAAARRRLVRAGAGGRRTRRRTAGGGRGTPGTAAGPNQCHDITVYPDVGLAGGACEGLGLLLDIREATHPIRIDFVGDPNMSFWHSATFSNDGKKVLFSDEWGGGSVAALPRDRQARSGAPTRSSPSRTTRWCSRATTRCRPRRRIRELRRAQRIDAFRSRAVKSWCRRSTRAASRSSTGRTRRSRSRSRTTTADRSTRRGCQRRLVVGVLVQRRHRELGNRARPRHLRARREPAHHPERNRRGEDREVRLLERAGTAKLRVAAERSRWRGRSSISSSARRACRLARITAVRAAIDSAEKASGGARRTALTTLATSLAADAKASTDRAKVTMLIAAVNELAKYGSGSRVLGFSGAPVRSWT